MSRLDRIRLALLRDEDQRLHNQIAGGYAKGNYAAKARWGQREVRDAIRRLEGRRRPTGLGLLVTFERDVLQQTVESTPVAHRNLE